MRQTSDKHREIHCIRMPPEARSITFITSLYWVSLASFRWPMSNGQIAARVSVTLFSGLTLFLRDR
jgi:hypothetical protein